MKTSKAMQEIVTRITEKHGVDLTVNEAFLRLDMQDFAPLIIRRVEKNLVSVGHYHKYGNNLVGDPEIICFTGYDEWIPSKISQSLGDFRIYAVTSADGESIGVLDPHRQAALAAFADIWAQRIKEQGWLEQGEKWDAGIPDLSRRPDLDTLILWADEGICEATDGCVVEPDGVCPHGCQSWLLELGLI